MEMANDEFVKNNSLGVIAMKKKLLDLLKTISPKIPDDTSFNLLEGDVLDSLDIIRIVAAIEKEFNVKINTYDITPEHFESVNEIAKLLHSYVDDRIPK